MQNSLICPKCNGEDILFIPGQAGAYGSGNYIQTGWANLSSVMVNRYVCCRCGYSEEWIDLKDMDRLRRKYE